MRDHVRILGILNILMGCFTALIGIVVFLFMGGAGVMTSMAGGYGDERIGGPIIAVVGMCIAVFFLILALPSIIGGWGIMEFKPWARLLMIVVSVLHLLNFPFGTALGVYGLWVLLSDEGRRLFGVPGRSYYPPGTYAVQGGQQPIPPQPVTQRPPATYPPQPPPGV